NKYQTHSDFVKGYQNVINKEKNLFSYFTGQSGTQEEIDTRSKSLVDAQKQMKSKVDNYTNSIKKVQKEKSDIDQYFK
ncbi:YkyA family protein, partial [Staphylococcus chromogenes]|uniref:YkyA family protein n=1 Tax=Staphylococcus chromogenes TaxID=46126 RepID=UPI000D406AD6